MITNMNTDAREPTMSVFRAGKGNTHAVDVPINDLQFIGEGAVGTVHRVTISPRREGLEPLYFAYKKLDSSDPNRIQTAYTIHQKLLELPHGRQFTVQTFRFTDEGLFMTDLSEGGKNLVVSSNDLEKDVLLEARQINKKNPNFISNFVQKEDLIANEEEWEAEFEKRADVIARETAEAGIKLQGDSIFFVIYPDGEYRLFVVDLDNVKLYENYPSDNLYQINLREIKDLKPHLLGLWLSLEKLL